MRSTPTNAPLPDILPMEVGVDRNTGRLVQLAGDEVLASLTRAYLDGSQIGTPLAESGLGRPALEDFLDFIAEARDGTLEGAQVLEVGCGGGALLQGLVDAGADALGLEPGEPAASAASRAGLDVIAQPFSRELFPDRRFDLIVHHAVLEHVPDPISFLRDQLRLLNPSGLVVCSVPDCTSALRHGDLSMLVHEHLSYFTAGSLNRTGGLAGAESVAARPGRAAGSLYRAWKPAPSEADPGEVADGLAAEFISQAPLAVRLVAQLAERLAGERRTLGIFCPARFFNYHAVIPTTPVVRYFDDDPRLHGLFYPPIDVAVEPRSALLADPVDELLIMSWTFGRRVAAELRSRPELAGTAIVTVEELLDWACEGPSIPSSR
jgi:SAM-dependent methyltransferase